MKEEMKKEYSFEFKLLIAAILSLIVVVYLMGMMIMATLLLISNRLIESIIYILGGLFVSMYLLELLMESMKKDE